MGKNASATARILKGSVCVTYHDKADRSDVKRRAFHHFCLHEGSHRAPRVALLQIHDAAEGDTEISPELLFERLSIRTVALRLGRCTRTEGQ